MRDKFLDNLGLTYFWGKIQALLNNKVDKEIGKGLSTNDYTGVDKNKLDNIEAGAEVNVQSDWNQSDSSADDYIKNKPTIPTPVTVDQTYNAQSANAQSGVAIEGKKPGEITTGTQYTIDGETVTAGLGAESFNDLTHNKASGQYSHAEGSVTAASGICSHAEGGNTTASGNCSHAEGELTTASSSWSHAEGVATAASGIRSHAEGGYTRASGDDSHAEGFYTRAASNYQHVQGKYNVTDSSDTYAFIIGNGTSDNARHNAFAIDWNGLIYVNGASTGVDVSQFTPVIVDQTYNAQSANAQSGVAIEGKKPGLKTAGTQYTIDGETVTAGTGAESFNDLEGNEAVGVYSHAEGGYSKAYGEYSHAEGAVTKATGDYSHAEGHNTTASGDYSHAEGQSTAASGLHSHVEGYSTTASARYSHAEGYDTTASGNASHAEGQNTIASGSHSHAEGLSTKASGDFSHAEGLVTTAASQYQHVQGKYNVADYSDTYAFIIGNGTGGSSGIRHNAFAIDWNGLIYVNGAATGVDVSAFPSPADINTAITKANAAAPQSTTYTKSQTDTLLDEKLDTSVIGTGTASTGWNNCRLSGGKIQYYNTNTTYSTATTSSSGLMSASDKQKLNGIAAGATNVTVDTTLSSTSTNPVQNKAVQAPLAMLIDKGAKNLLKITATSQTIKGVTFSVNDDGTITANGTATADANLFVNTDVSASILRSGKFTGCPTGGSGSTYRMILEQASYPYSAIAYDSGSGRDLSYTGNINANCYIQIKSGATVNNLVFKPMICTAEDYAISPEFVPYAKSNYELTRDVRPIPNLVDRGAKNLLHFDRVHVYSANGVTFTVNPDGTISTSGTATGAAYCGITLGGTFESDQVYIDEFCDGNHMLAGCPAGGNYSSGYSMYAASGSYTRADEGNGVLLTSTGGATYIRIIIMIRQGTNANGLVFKPMICTTEDWAVSHTSVPYAMSNSELTKKVTEFGTKLITVQLADRTFTKSYGGLYYSDKVDMSRSFSELYAATMQNFNSVRNISIQPMINNASKGLYLAVCDPSAPSSLSFTGGSVEFVIFGRLK